MKKRNSWDFERCARRAGFTFLLAVIVFGVLASAAPGEAASAAADGELSAAQIAESALEAAGGDALQRVTSLRREGAIDLSGPMFGELSGTWTVLAQPGSKGYQLADFGQGATATGWDGDRGWEESMMGVRDLAPTEVAINRVNWELHLLAALEREGKLGALERLADEEIDGLAHYVLQVGAAGALSADVGTRLYVHPETFLVVRLHMALEVPQVGSTAVVHTYSEFATYDVPGGGAVTLPQRVEQYIENVFDLKISLRETEMNGELDADRFEVPGP